MEPPVVETELGKYRGHYVQTLSGRQVAAFNGIRYAKPPVDKLRFKEAEKIGAHEGIYDASKDGDDSVQVNQIYTKYLPDESQGKEYVGSEDCLFLNVYTPQLNPDKTYPVIVFIHGGGYHRGTGSINWHGPHMLLDKDLILVTMNYRLGVFGFLALDEDALPSNLGLKDQVVALQWIKDHISCFGGDPNNITISGESAGSACVEFHMLSPRSRGLFKRAICESGSIRCPWAMLPFEELKQTTLLIASKLNCPTDSPAQLVASLQQKTLEEILKAVEQIKAGDAFKSWRMFFAPVVEKGSRGFIRLEDIKAGSTVPLLAGINKDEGFLFYIENYRAGDGDLSKTRKHYKQAFPIAMGFEKCSNQSEILEKIMDFYFKSEEISDKTLHQYVDMLSDGVFIHDVLQSVRQHHGQSFIYLLTHQGQRTLTYELPVKGVCHADELFYLFPFSKMPTTTFQFNQQDLKVQKLFVQSWANFATYGNPTPEKGVTEWPESLKGVNFVSITSDGIKPSQNMLSQRIQFWDNLSLDKFDLILKENR